MAAQTKKVDIQNTFIVIHPGTKLSSEDAAALDAMLQKYDKSLYKIQVYKNGQVTQTLGTLNDMRIDQRVAAELAAAKRNGESERAVQVIAPPQTGAATNPQQGSPTPGVAVNPNQGTPIPGATTNPQFNGSTTNPQRDASSTVNPQVTGTPLRPASGGTSQMAASATNPQFLGSTTNPQKGSMETPAPTDLIQKLTPILQKYSGEQ